MKTEEILKEMGFKPVTGTIWTHPTYGMISIEDEAPLTELAEVLIRTGGYLKVNALKAVLEIK